jgi:SAM-dependent methyltransferase
VGRWSRLVARDFLQWLDQGESLRWLDVGCGTGALSEAVVARCSPHSVVGVDRSEDYLEYARARVTDPRVSFRAGDAQALPVKDGDHDVIVSGLMLNFVPDAPKAVAEMKRALAPGGTAAAYVWDYAGEMQLMRRFWDAAVALDPPALELDEGRRFQGARPGPLVELFESAGLSQVRVNGDRRTDGLQGLRRLLDAVRRRPGARAGLLHVAQRGPARGAPRTDQGDHADQA